jgi:hypothetical protein
MGKSNDVPYADDNTYSSQGNAFVDSEYGLNGFNIKEGEIGTGTPIGGNCFVVKKRLYPTDTIGGGWGFTNVHPSNAGNHAWTLKTPSGTEYDIQNGYDVTFADTGTSLTLNNSAPSASQVDLSMNIICPPSDRKIVLANSTTFDTSLPQIIDKGVPINVNGILDISGGKEVVASALLVDASGQSAGQLYGSQNTFSNPNQDQCLRNLKIRNGASWQTTVGPFNQLLLQDSFNPTSEPFYGFPAFGNSQQSGTKWLSCSAPINFTPSIMLCYNSPRRFQYNLLGGRNCVCLFPTTTYNIPSGSDNAYYDPMNLRVNPKQDFPYLTSKGLGTVAQAGFGWSKANLPVPGFLNIDIRVRGYWDQPFIDTSNRAGFFKAGLLCQAYQPYPNPVPKWDKTIGQWQTSRSAEIPGTSTQYPFNFTASKTFNTFSADPSNNWQTGDVMAIYLEVPQSSPYNGTNENTFNLQRCDAMVTWKYNP